jgi:predicted transcriptional regulator
MRVHVELDDTLVREIDQLAGPRHRTEFIRRAVVSALAEEKSWAMLRLAAGAIPASGHDWDADPAAWVRGQRRRDPHRDGLNC